MYSPDDSHSKTQKLKVTKASIQQEEKNLIKSVWETSGGDRCLCHRFSDGFMGTTLSPNSSSCIH